MNKEKLLGDAVSILLGVMIGIPWSIIGVNSIKKPEIITETRYVVVKENVSELPSFQVYEMTEEDIKEEMYWDSMELLAILVEAEAEDQDLIGKRLVADVVLNRVDNPAWPDNVTDVILQPGQFTCVWNGRMDKITEPSEEAYEAVRMELQERLDTEICYFTADGYSKYGTPAYQHGDHYFSRR